MNSPHHVSHTGANHHHIKCLFSHNLGKICALLPKNSFVGAYFKRHICCMVMSNVCSAGPVKHFPEETEVLSTT